MNDRVRTSITPVSLNGFIYMVGNRSADRKPGKYLEALVVSGSFSSPPSVLHLPFYRLLGHYSETSLVHLLLELFVYHLKTEDGAISSIRWEAS